MIVAIIPARAGSKGFKNKNIAEVDGVSLLAYAVRSSKQSQLIDRTVVSTDSKVYEEIATSEGATSLGLREEVLAGDNSKTVDVVLKLLQHKSLQSVTHVILLQPTSPIRSGEMIDECISLAQKNRESVVSIAKIDDPHPAKLKRIVNGSIESYLPGAESEINRQELPDAYALTGAIYISTVENLISNKSFFSSNTQPYISRSFANIDSQDDFEYLEYLVEKGKVSLPK
ncbi:hypothetical protein A3Q34_06155 [Colwellia sp. PAMC 20917]|uniref:acylneuraminate cytidylyltransferase family protein n=1 Tax=Colwellia sp. PAMC 20917 TaxID=1816218 RepID=UPI000878367C|nr:acylneuraminate cytidylyltransferase family protein [Colwellia sp. PAMC 20917]AOW76477.1 hypothetical protein A3Q34_06155 [Colwellia sp. PAMC 20917]